MKTAYHIAIEGTIGVGKTSLAKLLAERLEGRLVLEKLIAVYCIMVTFHKLMRYFVRRFQKRHK